MNGDVNLFCFLPKITSLGKFGHKIQNSLFEMKWNLVPRLIPIYRIQWWYSIFLFFTGNTLFGQLWSKLKSLSNFSVFFFFGNTFLGKFDQKIKIISLSWNLVARLIQIFRIQWQCSLFSIFDLKYPFWVKFVHKIKIVRLSWNFVPTLC